MRQLVLFDIDGTLLMGKGIGREATRRAMLEVFGSSGTLDTHHFGGKTDWLTLAEVLAVAGITAEIVGQRMPDYERILAIHMAALVADYPIYALPGALEAVTHLRGRSDLILGIVTGNVAATAPVKLRAAGFDPDWFPIGAYGSESLDRNELSALAVARAAQLANERFAPESITVVGDTEADIACARAIGACAVAVATGFTAREVLVAAQPDHLLDDLHGLVEVLGSGVNGGSLWTAS